MLYYVHQNSNMVEDMINQVTKISACIKGNCCKFFLFIFCKQCSNFSQ